MIVDDVTQLLHEILGPAVKICASARLEADLQLESIDLLALGELLRDRHGDGVQFCAHLAGLEFDEILGLTVGDVAAYVAVATGRAQQ